VTSCRSQITLTSDRLTLRRHQFSDVDALSSLDTDVEARRFTGGVSDRKTTVEYLRRHIAEFGNGASWKFAVDLSDGGGMVGWCWLQHKEIIDGFEIGYQIDRRYWDQGIATEAARRVVQFGFEVVSLQAVKAIVDPANVASERVVQKLGFVVEREMPWDCPSGRVSIYKLERK